LNFHRAGLKRKPLVANALGVAGAPARHVVEPAKS
jgi:hypothetical protein